MALGFLSVIGVTGFFSTFVGIKLLDRSVVPRIQENVIADLKSSREMLQGAMTNVRDVVRLTSTRSFLKQGMLRGEVDALAPELQKVVKQESLDILNLTDARGVVLLRAANPQVKGDSQASNPLLPRVLREKEALVATQIITKNELLREGGDLADRAYMEISPTSGSNSARRDPETSGMFILAAAPVLSDTGDELGVLYGGILLNQNTWIVDRIRDAVFENDTYEGMDTGVVTIFQDDLRIATNVRTESGQRAVGTLVSDDVYKKVLVEGSSFNRIEFAVHDWYITAYEPIRDISGKAVGILGVGVLEAKYKAIERNALWTFLSISLGGVALSIVVSYSLTNSIMKPLNALLHAAGQLAHGHFEERIRTDDVPTEMAQLGDAFNYMAASVSERDRQLREDTQKELMKSGRLAIVGQLAAGVAHELNNPLGGILLFSRLLLQKAPPDALTRDNLQRIERDARRCQSIVEGLLDFAREREPKIEEVDVNELLERSVSLFANQPAFHNIEIVRQYGEDLPTFRADPAQMQQVFVNVIMNAADAMHGSGVLTLNTQWDSAGECVEIRFSDTGGGISQDVIDHVFEPFFTTKGVGQGTGLGLSICHGIVQKHGGIMKVSSQVGQGSTFVVCLPKDEGKLG